MKLSKYLLSMKLSEQLLSIVFIVSALTSLNFLVEGVTGQFSELGHQVNRAYSTPQIKTIENQNPVIEI